MLAKKFIFDPENFKNMSFFEKMKGFFQRSTPQCLPCTGANIWSPGLKLTENKWYTISNNLVKFEAKWSTGVRTASNSLGTARKNDPVVQVKLGKKMKI